MQALDQWSNLAAVTTRRTYSRTDSGFPENWTEIYERVIWGNARGHNVSEQEIKRLRYFFDARKAMCGGRGLWFSGTEAHKKIGGVALNNCWYISAESWEVLPKVMDLLMLGGGVGLSVEHRFVSKWKKVKKDVKIVHTDAKDADFIVPDSREGWCKLLGLVLEAFFVTGKGFSYSTCVIRGQGEKIRGFGGTASGPLPLISFVASLCALLNTRAGKHTRPIDVSDIATLIGALVKAGNVRRSAIIIIGDAWDKEFLTVKRWDLGPIPAHRSNANYSVVCDDIEDLHPLFWGSYEHGESIGLVNRKNIQQFGRMGEYKEDTAVGVNPCAEATLESFEPCNLQEIALPRLNGVEEFVEAAVLMHRWGKRVTLERYHHEEIQRVIERNRRIGTGITGCLQSPLFSPDVLDHVYAEIDRENARYSEELGIAKSIRTTVVKPSGTLSKVMDVDGEGVHAGLSRYIIQRIRFASDDKILPVLAGAGHYMEPEKKLDGTYDSNVVVVDFYRDHGPDLPKVDEGFNTWRQLDTLMLAQKHWSDQSVSVTVYYKIDEIAEIKEWLRNNFKNLKTISFLPYNDPERLKGFGQLPKEPISAEEYERLSAKITPIDIEDIPVGDLEDADCASGACPAR